MLENNSIFYLLFFFIIFFIVILSLIIFNTSVIGINKSKEQIDANTVILLSSSLIVFLIAIFFIPSLKDLKNLFLQISNVTYIIIYSIFFILFYTSLSKSILDSYKHIINPILFSVGGLLFFKGMSSNQTLERNDNFDRIKTIILFICLIAILTTTNIISPLISSDKSIIITSFIAIFAFLYMLISVFIGNNETLSKFSIFGILLLFAFIISIYSYIYTNEQTMLNNPTQFGSIMTLTMIVTILLSIVVGFNQSSLENVGNVEMYKKGLMAVYGIIISGLIIYWLTSSIMNYSGATNLVLNMLLIILILGLIYKTMNTKLPAGNENKNALFTLLEKTLLYIPCLTGNLFDGLGKYLVGQYNASDAGSFMMLFSVIVLIIVYFKSSDVANLINTQGGNQLVNNPVNADTLYTLGNYQELTGSDDFNYQYAISFWVFVDAMPPNTNPNYTKYTSLLNFGNKPNVLYNAEKNSLMITMQQKDLKNKEMTDFDDNGNRIIYKKDGFLLQKWNNIIINYNGGTLDIFLNGSLVRSAIEVVPYYTFDNLTIGENGGINAGICNVVYFRKPLNSTNIYFLYNTSKNSTPPILNDSNKSILVKNINTLSGSMENF